MNVLVICPSVRNTSPAQRYRIEQWAPYLERQGIRLTFAPFEDQALRDVIYRQGHTVRKGFHLLAALLRRLRLMFDVRRYDLVYIVREAALLGPAFFERLVARTGVPIVYDFDDAIWVPYRSPTNALAHLLKSFGKVGPICRLSTHVVVGNAHLAEFARRHDARVTVVPTTIDTDTYVPAARAAADDDLPVLGWTGSHSTVQHLNVLAPTLRVLRRQFPYRLHVLGTADYALDGVEVRARAWSAATEVRDVRSFDIGLMPLPDDDWARGKCGLKLLLCMALGIPTVASPVGVNSEIVQDGVNGLLATSEAEWLERLTRLARDRDLRRRLGDSGRATVEERYSARVWAPRVRDILEQAAAARGKAG
jgi:glycosyltransferase involved in cell wall biosynthesis